MRDTSRSGRAGEREAERELSRRGMTLLERNVRLKGAEIDLLALDGKTIVIIEVKARSSSAFGTPEEAVDRKKQRSLVRGARTFLAGKGLLDRARRYDIAAVHLDEEGHATVTGWTKAAFDEGEYD